MPDAAIGVRRSQGKWHPAIHLVAMLAIPLIYSVYLGIAESARDVALRAAMRRRDDADIQYLVGEMDNAVYAGWLVWRHMVDTAATGQPGPQVTDTIFKGRTLVYQAALQTVHKAMEVAGGGAFQRSLGLERLWRDIQAARYHPMQEKPQQRLAGRLALGLDIDG